MRKGFVDTSLLRTVISHSAITKMRAIAIAAIIVIAAIVGGSYYYMAPTPKREVTINMFVPTLPELPVIKAALPDFEKETGIKVTVEATEQTALIAKAIIAFQGKTGAYDLVISNAYGMGAYKPYAEPLDGYIQKYNFDRARYFERLINFYSFDGKQLGLPIMVTGRLMFYNQELLSKYGKSIPKTYDEVLQTARFFTKKFNPNSPTEFGIAFGGIRFYLDIGWKAALWAHGGEWSDRNWNPKFNSPEGVAALQYFVDLAECAPPGVASFSIAEPTAYFIEGKIPIIEHWNSQIFHAENKTKSKVAGKTIYASMPIGPSGKGPYNPASCWGAIVPTDSKHKEEAFLLLRYLCSEKFQKTILLIGSMPVMPSVYQDPTNIAELEKVYAPEYAKAVQYNVELAKYGRPFFELNPYQPGTIPEYTQIMDTEATFFQKALGKEMTAKEACDAAVKAVTEILRGAGYIK